MVMFKVEIGAMQMKLSVLRAVSLAFSYVNFPRTDTVLMNTLCE